MLKQDTLYSEKLANETEVAEGINNLASEIVQQFDGQDPLFVCLLRGGMPFASQLMFAITQQDPYFNPELDYMTVSSYGDGLTASEPKVVMDLSYKTTIANRPVIVLDDVIDKGGTYKFTKKYLEQKGAGKVYLAVLAQRELPEPRDINADFYCFSITSQEWLTGMGLDDPRLGKEANRWARYVAIANPQV
jgi:hypoxanthine phosphoribosyltransferase